MKTGRRVSRGFCVFSTPHELNFGLSMNTSCLVYSHSGIQSLFEVVLLYTFYTFGAETREPKTGILPLSRTS